MVPLEFVALLKAICAKLMGSNIVTPQVVNAALWTGMPARFRARRDYAKKKVFSKLFLSFLPFLDLYFLSCVLYLELALSLFLAFLYKKLNVPFML